MESLQASVAGLTRLATALAGLYFLIGFVLTLVQAQVAGATGSGLERSRALQQGLAMIFLLALAVTVQPLSAGLLRHFYQPGFQAPEPLREPQSLIALWSALAGLVINLAVGSGAVVLTVAAVYTGLGMQVARLIGLPLTLARSLGNLLTVLAGLALSLAASAIGRLILARVLAGG